MFRSVKIESSSETPEVDAAEARMRQRMEPIIEIMQHKGNSECDQVAGWSNDETCGFETLPYDSFGGGREGFLSSERRLPEANNFIKWALTEGLRQQQAGQQVQRDDQQVESRWICAPQTVAEQEDDLGAGAAGKLPGI